MPSLSKSRVAALTVVPSTLYFHSFNLPATNAKIPLSIREENQINPAPHGPKRFGNFLIEKLRRNLFTRDAVSGPHASSSSEFLTQKIDTKWNPCCPFLLPSQILRILLA